jgi:hypothetical protein
MVLLGVVGQVEARFGPFGDSINPEAIYVSGLRQMYPRLWNCFWAHLMVLLGVIGQVEARLSLFGDSINLDVI